MMNKRLLLEAWSSLVEGVFRVENNILSSKHVVHEILHNVTDF